MSPSSTANLTRRTRRLHLKRPFPRLRAEFGSAGPGVCASVPRHPAGIAMFGPITDNPAEGHVRCRR